MTQRYSGEGYVTESIGPVTFRQTTIGLAAAMGGLFVNLQKALKAGGLLPADPPNSTQSPVATPSPSPSASPF